MSSSEVHFGTTTIMMCLLFGTNTIFFLLFQYLKYIQSHPLSNRAIEEKEKKVVEKELSKPFDFTLESFTNLTSEIFKTGLIMALTYICENNWIFEHSGKSYSRDLFAFVLIIFFGYAFYTIKPNHDLTLLSREQTEEWKGWMQFIFLLYHYFHAEEVYNSVRVMITCYVWMTGFGNFSFFYMKQDYGWLRVVQMLWRLNFSVLLLMWTHGNTYILYYICPMHTFYFFMVYATMYVFSSINHSKWAIRWKLLFVGVIIYIVWDINGGIFDFVFSFLGTKSVIGATQGSIWEYYFRTSLDHWSAYLGMIFALNFPLAEQYFGKAKGAPLIFASVIMMGLFVYWCVEFYSKDKLEYNLTHSYAAIIPLTAYIFFRNLTPWLRSGVSMSLHDLGKTTLETYLLQHHIWLTSNAKTLLTIVPDHPWINFALATMLFFTVSKELYRLTMSLRGMLMPDDKDATFRNSIGMIVIVAILYGISLAITLKSATWLTILLGCLVLYLFTTLLIHRFCRPISEQPLFLLWSNRLVIVCSALTGLCLVALIVAASPTNVDDVDGVGKIVKNVASPFKGQSLTCQQNIMSGKWMETHCEDAAPSLSSNFKLNEIAVCDTDIWKWDSSATAECPIGRVTTAKAKTIFKNKQILFVGDSSIRGVYHQFNSLLDPKYKQNTTSSYKHSDLNNVAWGVNSTFIWSPFISNMTDYFDRQIVSADFYILGAAMWDALYFRNLPQYTLYLDKLVDTATVVKLKSSAVTVWLQPTTIINSQLISSDKKQYMTEENIALYRQAVFSTAKMSSFFQLNGAIINPINVCKGKEGSSIDGIHYDDDVNKVLVQLIANAYAMRNAKNYVTPMNAGKTIKESPPKPTGSMSFPAYGAIVLALSIVMLFCMDNWLGIGFLSLQIFGRSYDWEAAYGPLINKIFGQGKNSKPKEKVAAQAREEGDADTDKLLVEEHKVATNQGHSELSK